MPKKGGLGQFADLGLGGLGKRGGGGFGGGGYPNAHYDGACNLTKQHFEILNCFLFQIMSEQSLP